MSGDCTPNSGSGSCQRNQHSVPESINAIPSVGSPGSIGLSPHPNSSLSQPTSVPPPDQVSARAREIPSHTQTTNNYFSQSQPDDANHITHSANISAQHDASHPHRTH